MREHCVIVGEIDLEPLRDGEQALRLRRKVGTARIGAADDQGEAIDRRIRDAISLDEGIEAAELTMMTELDVRDVVWCRADVLGRFQDSGGRHVDEFCLRIDEPADEPGASDTIDRGPLACHPLARRGSYSAPRRKSSFSPRREAALHVAGVDAGRSERGGDALAHLLSADAANNHAPTIRDLAPPPIDFGRETANCAGDLAIGGIEVLRTAHVDDERCRGGANGLVEVFRRNVASNSVHALSPRHVRVLSRAWTASRLGSAGSLRIPTTGKYSREAFPRKA